MNNLNIVEFSPEDITKIIAYRALTGKLPNLYKNKTVSIEQLIKAVAPSMTLGENRELIVAEIISAAPLTETLNGHDSVLKYKNQERYIEVKTESHTNKKRKPLGGRLSMGISTLELFEKIKNDNPLMVICGFTDNNDLIYMISFNFSDLGFLNEWKIKGLSNNSNKHSFGYGIYKSYESTVVHFVNTTLVDICCTKPFANWLVANTKIIKHNKTGRICIINEAF